MSDSEQPTSPPSDIVPKKKEEESLSTNNYEFTNKEERNSSTNDNLESFKNNRESFSTNVNFQPETKEQENSEDEPEKSEEIIVNNANNIENLSKEERKRRVTFSNEGVEYISAGTATYEDIFDESYDIDTEIDDAIDEGCMGIECTLERGFSLNEKCSSTGSKEENYHDQCSPYVHKNVFNRYGQSLKHFIPIRKASKNKKAMLIDNAGMFSYISFSWVGTLMWKAYKEGLNEDDLPLCSKYDTCYLNADRLELLWDEEVRKNGLEKASLQRSIWRFIRTRILFSTLIFLATLTCGFLGPTIFMRNLIHWLSTDEPLTVGIYWSVGLVLCEFLRISLFALVWAINHRTAVRLRSACLGLIYKKLMKMSNLGNKSIGEVINLFANDSQRVYDFVILGPMVIGGPMVAVGGFVYIFFILGPWALLGMLSFLVFYPLQYGISRLTGYFRRKTIVQTDHRVRLMNELLSCIKLIKMYAWEGSFTESITAIRNHERKFLEKSAYVQSLSIAMAPTVPVLAAIVTFLVHIGAGNNLTPAQALSVVAFLLGNVRSSFNMMRFSLQAIVEYMESRLRIQVFSVLGVMVRVRGMLHYIPYSTMAIYDYLITTERYKSVLVLEEMEDYVQKVDSEIAIELKNVSFAWSLVKTPPQKSKSKRNKDKNKGNGKIEKAEEVLLQSNQSEKIEVLHDIDIDINKGDLIGICGGVGAGKSSLLFGCLGQMHLTKGTVKVSGSFAFVGQQAWILNASLRENIVLGEPFVAKRYYRVVHACYLTDDISDLPAGDLTEIGEKGINLSGGQKQRVSLARALYSNKDIYLLDNCLSAVDSEVGQHIFQWVIKVALREKTVLFVTHQMQYMPFCDKVILLKNGRILETGAHLKLVSLQNEYCNLFDNHMEMLQNLDSQDSEAIAILDDMKPSVDTPVPVIKKSFADKKFLNTKPTKKGQLISEEALEKGNIPTSVYKSYVGYAGGYLVCACVIMTFALNVGATAFSSWWLSYWLNAGSGNSSVTIGNETIVSDNIADNPDVGFYKIVYGSIIIMIFITSILRGFAFMKITIKASTLMHSDIFDKILRCPMSFFDCTPSGRIINIFSRDMDEVDVRLPYTMESFVQNMWLILASFAFVCMVFPQFMIFLVFLAAFFIYVRNIFSVGVRDLKRYENVSRSPLYSHISTTINGLPSIQACCKQQMFSKRFRMLFDDNSCKYYLFNCAIRWLAIRLDILALCCTGMTAFFSVIMKDSVGPAYAGLALAYSSQLSGVFQFTVRLSTETEARFTSVHRIVSHIKTLTSEALLIKPKRPNPHWPKFGRITFKNVCMAYRESLPLVLRKITFGIEAEEKIGVIGKTGAGKSSLSVALFRLVELESGLIEIDGLDISTIGLFDLRSHLSIIPQDPVLFMGTVRYNLDPFNKHSDEAIWMSLEKTYMKETISSLGEKLLSPVVENGENFSIGERQLLCMARAILRNSKIIILDEATSGIDTKTDNKIQATLKDAFASCTMITIAHRLNTIMGCSRVLVMDRGKVVEFDSPQVLLSRRNSRFYKMVQAVENGQDSDE